MNRTILDESNALLRRMEAHLKAFRQLLDGRPVDRDLDREGRELRQDLEIFLDRFKVPDPE
jgi:hypothetical protein